MDRGGDLTLPARHGHDRAEREEEGAVVPAARSASGSASARAAHRGAAGRVGGGRWRVAAKRERPLFIVLGCCCCGAGPRLKLATMHVECVVVVTKDGVTASFVGLFVVCCCAVMFALKTVVACACRS